MPELTERQVDAHLAAMERDLGPTLRSAFRGRSMRTGFPAELRARLRDSITTRNDMRRSSLRALPQRAWAGLAAVLVGGVVLSVAVFATRAQPVSAADVMDQLQAEAFSVSVVGTGPCTEPKDAPGLTVTGGLALGQPGSPPQGPTTVQNATAGVVVGQPGSPPEGPTTVQNATELSDRLAQTLGVSGDRVREAMLATVRDTLPPSPPPDPMASIAKQLGMSREQVCSAFMDSAPPR